MSVGPNCQHGAVGDLQRTSAAWGGGFTLFPYSLASTGGVGYATVPPEELQKLLDDFLKHGIAPRDGIALDPRPSGRAEQQARMS